MTCQDKGDVARDVASDMAPPDILEIVQCCDWLEILP